MLAKLILYLFSLLTQFKLQPLFHQFLQLVQMGLIDVSGLDTIFLADNSSHSDHFPHHPRCTHDTDSSQSNMGHTYITACHKQIVDIPGI